MQNQSPALLAGAYYEKQYSFSLFEIWKMSPIPFKKEKENGKEKETEKCPWLSLIFLLARVSFNMWKN